MALSNPAFQYLQNLAGSRSGIALPENEKFLVEARLLPLVRQQNMKSVSELVAKAQSESNGDFQLTVLEALLPKDTSFFRDSSAFELLKNRIFRTLEMQRFSTQKLSIWCAGCSTGQEAYSIAMLVHRYFSQLLRWNLEIYATDFSKEALDKAREARYDEVEVYRGVAPVLIKEYFRQEGPHFLLKQDVSQLVQFDELNLAGDWPELTQVDVVFLRNVLRYMNPGVQRDVLRKLKRVLAPDGYLFVGTQESAAELDRSFKLVPVEKAVYFQLSQTPSS